MIIELNNKFFFSSCIYFFFFYVFTLMCVAVASGFLSLGNDVTLFPLKTKGLDLNSEWI